ncbi:hypothetical protein [Massilia eburnea]|uniref:hypothetical protein n=1 Tax=Massilia eburnea TaxID=1776165 RepID=UPI003D6A68F4
MKRSLMVVGVFGLCWIAAVWYWRTTTRMPDTSDLALAMLVMPLTLIVGIVVARKTFDAPAAVPSGAGGAQAPAAAVQDGQGAQGVANTPDAAAPWTQFAVAATALRMAHGDSPAELAAAIAEGEARLDLDPELTDLQGFPLLAGRVADIALEPLEEWLSTTAAGSAHTVGTAHARHGAGWRYRKHPRFARHGVRQRKRAATASLAATGLAGHHAGIGYALAGTLRCRNRLAAGAAACPPASGCGARFRDFRTASSGDAACRAARRVGPGGGRQGAST